MGLPIQYFAGKDYLEGAFLILSWEVQLCDGAITRELC